MLLAKVKLNKMKILISKVLMDLNVSHDECVVKKFVTEYDDMKEEI